MVFNPDRVAEPPVNLLKLREKMQMLAVLEDSDLGAAVCSISKLWAIQMHGQNQGVVHYGAKDT